MHFRVLRVIADDLNCKKGTEPVVPAPGVRHDGEVGFSNGRHWSSRPESNSRRRKVPGRAKCEKNFPRFFCSFPSSLPFHFMATPNCGRVLLIRLAPSTGRPRVLPAEFLPEMDQQGNPVGRFRGPDVGHSSRTQRLRNRSLRSAGTGDIPLKWRPDSSKQLRTARIGRKSDHT